MPLPRLLDYCSASVVDGGPILNQHWANVSCSLDNDWNVGEMFNQCIVFATQLRHGVLVLFICNNVLLILSRLNEPEVDDAVIYSLWCEHRENDNCECNI